MRLRLQLFFHPLAIIFQFIHHFLVGRLELHQQRLIFYVLKSFRNVFLKKTDQAGNLLQRHIHINRRRILQVLPRCLKYGGDLLFPRDDRLHPLSRRRERPRHDQKDRVGNSGRI